MAEGSTLSSRQALGLMTPFTSADSLNIYFTVWCQLNNYGRTLPAPDFPLDNWQQVALPRARDVCALTTWVGWVRQANLKSN